MRRFGTRCLVLISILFIFFIGIIFSQYTHSAFPAKADIGKIPLDVAGWQGKDITADKRTKAILEADSLLIREYKKGINSMWLVIIYYNNNRVSLRLPESWAEGQVKRILFKDVQKIIIPQEKNFLVNRMILTGNKRNQAIIYYFETEAQKTNSYQGMRWQMILNRLKSKSNGGAVIRLSSPINQNIQKTLEVLAEFTKQVAPLISKQLFGNILK
jgi:EpsI family protein